MVCPLIRALLFLMCFLSTQGIVQSRIVSFVSGSAASNSTAHDIPIIEHVKEPGQGYVEGSPLYEIQQRKRFVQKELEKEISEEKKLHDRNDPKGARSRDEGYWPDWFGNSASKSSINKDEGHDPAVDYSIADPKWRPVSVTMQCILNLCLQYFLIYAMLAIVRMYHMLTDSPGSEAPSPALKTLGSATATVYYAPMLCVLFLSTRMRAIQLTQGRTEEFMLPQKWVQFCMRACTWAVAMQLLIVLAMPLMTGKPAVTDHDGNVEVHRVGQGACSIFCIILRYMIMAALYFGFIGVCVGVHHMEAPKEVYPEGTPPVSPAVHCVIILSTIYFIVYFILAVLRTINQLNDIVHTKASDTFQYASYTVNLSPMLCILFIATRMRALQMDPRHGNPQRWAQHCMYICTFSVALQTALVILVPYCLEGKTRKGPSEGDILFDVKNQCCNTFLIIFHWIRVLCLYGGFSIVIYSVIVIEHPKGARHTPEVSPTLHCVIILTIQFFSVYLFLWLAITINQLQSQTNEVNTPSTTSARRSRRGERNILIATLDSARNIIIHCPMLAILFVGCRMRALQLTANKGAPPSWAQDCMYLATFSSVGQLFVVLLTGMLSQTGERKSRADDDDEDMPRSRGDRTCVAIAESVQMLLLVTMWVGAIGVAICVITMRPETCTGRGSQLPMAAKGKEQQFPE